MLMESGGKDFDKQILIDKKQMCLWWHICFFVCVKNTQVKQYIVFLLCFGLTFWA